MNTKHAGIKKKQTKKRPLDCNPHQLKIIALTHLDVTGVNEAYVAGLLSLDLANQVVTWFVVSPIIVLWFVNVAIQQTNKMTQEQINNP